MEGFSARLRAENAADWDAAVTHRFVDEIFSGTVAPDVMRRYLVQDYQFIDGFVALLGAAIASADTFAARIRFSRFAAMITSDENTYFIRSFNALGVSEDERSRPVPAPVTRDFQTLMREAADSRSYAACLAVLIVAEWLYLDWASRSLATPENFVHAEWITLHNNPAFAEFVGWMRSELDHIHDQMSDEDRSTATRYFARAVQLERGFFDALYA